MEQELSPEIKRRLIKLAKEWGEGRINLKQIVGLNPQEMYAISAQGYLLFLEGKYEDAKTLFEGLISLDQKNSYYYNALGSIYWKLGESNKAIKQFGNAIKVNPKSASSYINRAEVLISSKKFNDAKNDLRTSIAKSQNHEDALVRKARAMLRMIE